MSQADANSADGESQRAGHTGTGCYKNHDHHMEEVVQDKINTAVPGVITSSGGTNILGISEPEKGGLLNAKELHNQEVPSLQTASGELSRKRQNDNNTLTSDKLPNIFNQDLKEFLDAECLVPAPVTESTLQIELKPLKKEGQQRPSASGGNDLASMDSTDTFASCTTHPFNSQADLTEETSKDSNLYVNPMEAADEARFITSVASPKHFQKSPKSSPRHHRYLARPQAYTTDSFDDAKSTDSLLRGSTSSLQDSPLPKHRRTRFQEVNPRPFSRLLESVERARAARQDRAAGATSDRGRSGSKSSIGADSTDSKKSSPERKKSILKNKSGVAEGERLLADSSSTRRQKPHHLPVKFIGIDEDEEDKKVHKVLPRSPMPSPHSRAPLANLFADFGVREKSAAGETKTETLLKVPLQPTVIPLVPSLDQRNANLVLQCSAIPCMFNCPPSYATATADPNTGPPPFCVCGAPMTRVPAMPANMPESNINVTPAFITSIGSPETNANAAETLLLTTDDLDNGPATIRNLDDFLYADHTPTEDTHLMDTSFSVVHNSEINS